MHSHRTGAMQYWKNCGNAANVTSSLQIQWSSPFEGEAHPRGSRSNLDAPWWDTRGTGEPSLRSRTPTLTMGSYNRIVQGAGISFHAYNSKSERKDREVVHGNHCSWWMARLYSSAQI